MPPRRFAVKHPLRRNPSAAFGDTSPYTGEARPAVNQPSEGETLRSPAATSCRRLRTVGAIIDRPPMDLQLYGGAIIASLFEGGVEQSETEGVMRLRRMRSAETSLPTRCAAIRAAAKYRVAGSNRMLTATHSRGDH